MLSLKKNNSLKRTRKKLRQEALTEKEGWIEGVKEKPAKLNNLLLTTPKLNFGNKIGELNYVKQSLATAIYLAAQEYLLISGKRQTIRLRIPLN